MALRFVFLILIALRLPICSQSPPAMAQSDPTRAGLDRNEPIRVTGSLWLAVGFGNTFLIQTSAGNILVDTSLPNHALRHKKMLDAVAPGPVRYMVLTHAHGDHTGGVPLWREPGTQIVARRNHVEFRHYQARLAGFFASRNSAQFGPGIGAIARPGSAAGNYPARIDATFLFADKHEFELGGLKVEVHHTPGETDDHLSVWIPQWRAAFVGDNI